MRIAIIPPPAAAALLLGPALAACAPGGQVGYSAADRMAMDALHAASLRTAAVPDGLRLTPVGDAGARSWRVGYERQRSAPAAARRSQCDRTHDRCVGVCYRDEVDIGAEMVRRGLAGNCPRFARGHRVPVYAAELEMAAPSVAGSG